MRSRGRHGRGGGGVHEQREPEREAQPPWSTTTGRRRRPLSDPEDRQRGPRRRGRSSAVLRASISTSCRCGILLQGEWSPDGGHCGDGRTRPPLRAADRRTIYEGRIVTLALERFRFADGEEVEREVVHHQGAVGVLAHDDAHLVLVRQPREAVGDPDVLEIPAGRLDQEGEAPLDAARRELAEEVGLQAASWEPVATFVSSVGMTDELVHVFHATGLSPSDGTAQAEEDERIEVVRWPLEDLDGAIAATRDAKTLVALLWLKARR